MNKLTFLILTLAAFSCHSQSKSPKEANIKIREDLNPNGLKIDLTILSQIENELNKNCEPFNREVFNYDEDGNEELNVLDTGIVFKFIIREKAKLIFESYHDKILEGGNYLFLTNMDFDPSYNSYFDIVVINCVDPYKLIEMIGTQGINYDLYNDDIIKKLKEWDTQVGFKFDIVDYSRLHAQMTKLPADLPKFTNEVYEFCPDVIEQGYESMEEMISDYRQNKYFWLWWD